MTNQARRRIAASVARPLAMGGALGLVAGTTSTITAPTPAAAHGFADNHYVADNSEHTWISTEPTQSERDIMQPFVDDRMVNQWDARTQLTSNKQSSYHDNVDVYWFVTESLTAGAAADATCIAFTSGTQGGQSRCNRARIRFRTSWMLSTSADQKRQGACHEIGHTVGFDDSVPEASIGCMSGGPNGVLTTHEINHINAFYDPY